LGSSNLDEIRGLFTSAESYLAECADRPIRNAQVTVIAPTGTIGLFMGCDTTGIEPELGLVKYKQVVGGGTEVIVNQSIREALERLGYEEQAVAAIEKYILEKNTVIGAPYLGEKYYPVFATALGDNTISWKGHIMMMAAVQPFVSGAISKTINCNHSITIEEFEDIYKFAYKRGLKCVAIYRDGSKGSQPVTVSKTKVESKLRHKLPEQCTGHRLKFNLGSNEVYIHTGDFADGSLGEIFITASKSGSTLQGLLNSTAIAISTGLQYGTPLKTFVKLLRHQKFEPAGIVQLPGQERPHFYSSVLDVIAHWLDVTYLDGSIGNDVTETLVKPNADKDHNDLPMCDRCGNQTFRNGTCFCCSSCGYTSGCS